MKKQHLPTGWSEGRVRKLLSQYERQTEEESVAEDEAALQRRDQTVMVVPKRLVPKITKMITQEGKRGQNTPRQSHKPTGPERSHVAARRKRENVRSGRSV